MQVSPPYTSATRVPGVFLLLTEYSFIYHFKYYFEVVSSKSYRYLKNKNNGLANTHNRLQSMERKNSFHETYVSKLDAQNSKFFETLNEMK